MKPGLPSNAARTARSLASAPDHVRCEQRRTGGRQQQRTPRPSSRGVRRGARAGGLGPAARSGRGDHRRRRGRDAVVVDRVRAAARRRAHLRWHPGRPALGADRVPLHAGGPRPAGARRESRPDRWGRGRHRGGQAPVPRNRVRPGRPHVRRRRPGADGAGPPGLGPARGPRDGVARRGLADARARVGVHLRHRRVPRPAGPPAGGHAPGRPVGGVRPRREAVPVLPGPRPRLAGR